MNSWFELNTSAGRLRRTHRSQVIIGELEAVAELDLGPPFLTRDGTPTWWTLDGVPVSEDRARAIIEAMRVEDGRTIYDDPTTTTTDRTEGNDDAGSSGGA